MPPAEPRTAPDADTRLSTLPNGVRVLTLRLPAVETAAVSVFVRTGSRDEPARLGGISHMAEHMAFKGTRQRSCQQINWDAERLGAEVNAHTDKDHTAYHMRGLASDAPEFVRQLGEIVRESSFPADELERERQVILQELAETEDDAFDTAFRLFDKACWGEHPLARPVIGRRASIERIGRDDLQAYVAGRYTGGHTVVAAAGPVDHTQVVDAAARALGSLPPGAPPTVAAPVFRGGRGIKHMAGQSQAHLVFGFPSLPVTDPGHTAVQVAAAVLGEGMSSPLMDTLRERLGLVYYAACSADLDDLAGQFVIEASLAAENVAACVDEVERLLAGLAREVSAEHLERARHQLAVRRLRHWERPARRLEDAVLDLYTFGRVRPLAERRQALQAVDAAQVRGVFERLRTGPAALGAAGHLTRPALERLRRLVPAAA